MLYIYHHALNLLLNNPEPSGHFTRWLVRLPEFDFKIKLKMRLKIIASTHFPDYELDQQQSLTEMMTFWHFI